jgi:hypothetical protein
MVSYASLGEGGNIIRWPKLADGIPFFIPLRYISNYPLPTLAIDGIVLTTAILPEEIILPLPLSSLQPSSRMVLAYQ